MSFRSVLVLISLGAVFVFAPAAMTGQSPEFPVDIIPDGDSGTQIQR